MADLSVIIPARNEQFLSKTVENILQNIRGDTEIIVIMDGEWANPSLPVAEKVNVIYHNKSIGQRASTNEGVRLSRAKYMMKIDAHCSVDEGFDVKLMADCKYDWTIIPRMYNLHAFDWKCIKCGDRVYQGKTPTECNKCSNKNSNNNEFEKVMVWKPRLSRRSDFMRFDKDLRFAYWGSFKFRPEGQKDIAPTMSFLGACWFMHRKRYLELGGLDEGHGSWGQVGTELACKSWLSGGKLLVNKKTWFSHMFRTQGGDFGFPYRIRGKDVNKARDYSRELWINNKWPKAKYRLKWLVDKFAPVPTWHDTDVDNKGIVYYTDNQLRLAIARSVQRQLEVMGLPIVSASLKPMNFGNNIRLKLERGYLTMFKQILAALEESTATIIFFCEHDVLYHPSHFDFTPPKKDIFYYNTNIWKIRQDGHTMRTGDCRQTSGLCAYRDLLLRHYTDRVRRVEKLGFTRKMGFEPGTHNRKERIDDYKSETWESKYSNLDIRHDKNLTPSRWKKEQFRNEKYTEGWQESNIKSIRGWDASKIAFE
tara:strand:- start:1168 stop:2775 length:1608 start_codon:yes stop_codon:yes gene_type:complete